MTILCQSLSLSMKKRHQCAERPAEMCIGVTHQVLYQVGYSQGAQTAQCEAPDSRVLVPAILGEQIDGQERHVGVALRVGADVQVQHLLELNVIVIGDGTVYDLHEQAAHVDSDGHVVDDTFENVFLGLDTIRLGVTGSAQIGQARPDLAQLTSSFFPSHCISCL